MRHTLPPLTRSLCKSGTCRISLKENSPKTPWSNCATSSLAGELPLPLPPDPRHKLAALASYTEEQSTSYAQTHSYAIHLFSVHNGSLQTDRIIPLVYQPVSLPLQPPLTCQPSDARALDAPRLFVPASSPTAFVRFANAVVLVSLDGAPPLPGQKLISDDYEDVISLKDASRNAFIGIGCISAPVSSRRTAAPALTLMPIFGGLVEIDIVDGPTS